jgi:hypothetical protein
VVRFRSSLLSAGLRCDAHASCRGPRCRPYKSLPNRTGFSRRWARNEHSCIHLLSTDLDASSVDPLPSLCAARQPDRQLVNPITGKLQFEMPKRFVGTNAKAGATHSSLERIIPLPSVVISALCLAVPLAAKTRRRRTDKARRSRATEGNPAQSVSECTLSGVTDELPVDCRTLSAVNDDRRAPSASCCASPHTAAKPTSATPGLKVICSERLQR